MRDDPTSPPREATGPPLDTSELQITGVLLAKNTLLNLVGLATPLVVGVISIPFIIRSLGVPRYGLLSLVAVALGFFAVFDLGLGRSVAKHVAQALGGGRTSDVGPTVWTAAAIQGVLGTAGALVLVALTPFLVEQVLQVPPGLKPEARIVFYLVAATLPFQLVSSSFSGALEGAQRFGLVNAIRIPATSAHYLLALLGGALGWGLDAVVALILMAKVAAAASLAMLCRRVLPHGEGVRISRAMLRPLLSFGAWVTVSNTVNPVLVYLDRLVIASVISVAALAFYTPPFQLMYGLLVIPHSIAHTIFPAYSALEASGDADRLARLFSKTVRYLLLAMGPIAVSVAIFAPDILTVWIGPSFAGRAAPVLAILSFGLLMNSVAQSPYYLLQALGRPDITAKLHLIELPLHVVATWLLTRRFGLAGAAAAWTLRATVDAVLLLVLSKIVAAPRRGASAGLAHLVPPVVAVATFAGAMFVVYRVADLPLAAGIALFAIQSGVYAWVVWTRVLHADDRALAAAIVRGFLPGPRISERSG